MSMLQYEHISRGRAVAKSRRLQVLIEDEQWSRLEALAADRGVSVASVVRDAIDRTVPGGRAERRRAVLEAEPMPVPDPPELRKELEELRGSRA